MPPKRKKGVVAVKREKDPDPETVATEEAETVAEETEAEEVEVSAREADEAEADDDDDGSKQQQQQQKKKTKTKKKSDKVKAEAVETPETPLFCPCCCIRFHSFKLFKHHLTKNPACSNHGRAKRILGADRFCATCPVCAGKDEQQTSALHVEKCLETVAPSVASFIQNYLSLVADSGDKGGDDDNDTDVKDDGDNDNNGGGDEIYWIDWRMKKLNGKNDGESTSTPASSTVKDLVFAYLDRWMDESCHYCCMLEKISVDGKAVFKCPWPFCSNSFTTVMGFKYHSTKSSHRIVLKAEEAAKLPPNTALPLQISVLKIPHNFGGDEDILEQYYSALIEIDQEHQHHPGLVISDPMTSASAAAAGSLTKRSRKSGNKFNSSRRGAAGGGGVGGAVANSIKRDLLVHLPFTLTGPLACNLSIDSSNVNSMNEVSNEIIVSSFESDSADRADLYNFKCLPHQQSSPASVLAFEESLMLVAVASNPIGTQIPVPIHGDNDAESSAPQQGSPTFLEIFQFVGAGAPPLNQEGSSSASTTFPNVFKTLMLFKSPLPWTWIRRLQFVPVHCPGITCVLLALTSSGVFFIYIQQQQPQAPARVQLQRVNSDPLITDIKVVSAISPGGLGGPTRQPGLFAVTSNALGEMRLYRILMLLDTAGDGIVASFHLERSIHSNVTAINQLDIQVCYNNTSNINSDGEGVLGSARLCSLIVSCCSLDGRLVQWLPFDFPFHPRLIHGQFSLINVLSTANLAPLQFCISDGFGVTRFGTFPEAVAGSSASSRLNPPTPPIVNERILLQPGKMTFNSVTSVPKNVHTVAHCTGGRVSLFCQRDGSLCITSIGYGDNRKRRSDLLYFHHHIEGVETETETETETVVEEEKRSRIVVSMGTPNPETLGPVMRPISAVHVLGSYNNPNPVSGLESSSNNSTSSFFLDSFLVGFDTGHIITIHGNWDFY